MIFPKFVLKKIVSYRETNSFEYKRLGVASIKATLQQVKIISKALFLVDLGMKGLTIARYLWNNHFFTANVQSTISTWTVLVYVII